MRAEETRAGAAGGSLSSSEELPDEVCDAFTHWGHAGVQQDQTRGSCWLFGISRTTFTFYENTLCRYEKRILTSCFVFAGWISSAH